MVRASQRRSGPSFFLGTLPPSSSLISSSCPHSDVFTMPPLPSPTQTLTSRLNNISESNKSILQLIQRLSKLDFQPGSVPLNSEEGDIRLELSAEIHESLKSCEEELELLRQEVEDVVQRPGSTVRRRDSVRESETSRLAVLLARLTEDLKSYVASTASSSKYFTLTHTHVVHGHNTAKPNSQPNATPTAPNSKNANFSSQTFNLELRPPPPHTAAPRRLTPSSQNRKLSQTPRAT
jgi:hypothetical protein